MHKSWTINETCRTRWLTLFTLQRFIPDRIRVCCQEVATLAGRLEQTVALYVQDGLGNDNNEKYGFTVHDTGPVPKGRWTRMVFGGWRMYRAVRRAKPKIAHFHDPELIPFAALLRFSGIKVIYDAHEDIELQVLHKPYLPSWSRRPMSRILAITEGLAMRWFDGTVAVLEDLIRKRPGGNKITVTNFPDLSEFDDFLRDAPPARERRFVYAGSITRPRGALEMVEAMRHVKSADATLALMGNSTPKRWRQLPDRRGMAQSGLQGMEQPGDRRG